MSDFEFVLVHGNDFNLQTNVFEFVIGGGRGAAGTTDHLLLEHIGVNTHIEIDLHINDVSNPHSVTKTQVGLGNVTDDAQLKRSAGDYQAFTQKITPEVGDSILIEDSSDGWNKKWITIDGIKTIFRTAFDLVYQPLSSALSKITEAGGLPLWDGGAWPGGGGGAAEWEGVASFTVSTPLATVDFIGVFTSAYKTYRVILEDIRPVTGNRAIGLQFGVSGVFTVTGYHYHQGQPSATSGGWFGATTTVGAFILLSNPGALAADGYEGDLVISGVRDATVSTKVRGEGARTNNSSALFGSPVWGKTPAVLAYDDLRVLASGDQVQTGKIIIQGKN